MLNLIYKNNSNDGFSTKSLNRNFAVNFGNPIDSTAHLEICKIYKGCEIKNPIYILTENNSFFVDHEKSKYCAFGKINKVLYSCFGFIGLLNSEKDYKYIIETGAPNNKKYILTLNFKLDFGCVFHKDSFIVGNKDFIVSNINSYSIDMYSNVNQMNIDECINDNEKCINYYIDNCLTQKYRIKSLDENFNIFDCEYICYQNYDKSNMNNIPVVFTYYYGNNTLETIFETVKNVEDIFNLVILICLDFNFAHSGIYEINEIKFYFDNKWNDYNFLNAYEHYMKLII